MLQHRPPTRNGARTEPVQTKVAKSIYRLETKRKRNRAGTPKGLRQMSAAMHPSRNIRSVNPLIQKLAHVKRGNESEAAAEREAALPQ